MKGDIIKLPYLIVFQSLVILLISSNIAQAHSQWPSGPVFLGPFILLLSALLFSVLFLIFIIVNKTFSILSAQRLLLFFLLCVLSLFIMLGFEGLVVNVFYQGDYNLYLDVSFIIIFPMTFVFFIGNFRAETKNTTIKKLNVTIGTINLCWIVYLFVISEFM